MAIGSHFQPKPRSQLSCHLYSPISSHAQEVHRTDMAGKSDAGSQETMKPGPSWIRSHVLL